MQYMMSDTYLKQNLKILISMIFKTKCFPANIIIRPIFDLVFQNCLLQTRIRHMGFLVNVQNVPPLSTKKNKTPQKVVSPGKRGKLFL